jgi:septum formation protein
VVPPRIDDERAYIDTADLQNSLRRLSAMKADSVACSNPDALVLGSDTVVVVDGDVLGKPGGTDEARDMIERLSGRTHDVITGVALLCRERSYSRSAAAVTQVTFRTLHSAEIEEYLTDTDCLDKAGAYGIQGKAMALVESIRGCYYNVVGLPVSATIGLFEDYARSGGSVNAGT